LALLEANRMLNQCAGSDWLELIAVYCAVMGLVDRFASTAATADWIYSKQTSSGNLISPQIVHFRKIC